MIAAPMGLPGHALIDPFARMARGENALNEHNTKLGEWTHPHGWGAVYEDHGGIQAIRGTTACWDDRDLRTLLDRRVFLLHARRASLGSVTAENTHPFEEKVDGSSWFFCHNGTVRGIASPGESDSREIFRRLLPYVREGRTLEGIREVYGGFEDFSSLNSFLLGPEEFWAVCSYSRNPAYYTLALAQTEDGPIVASEPLAEFPDGRVELSNRTILRIDRRSGENEQHALAQTRLPAVHPLVSPRLSAPFAHQTKRPS